MKHEGPYITQGDNWSHYFQNLKLQDPYFNDSTFFSAILKHFYTQGDSWEDFEKYLEPGYIRQQKLELDYFSGKEIKESELGSLPHDAQKSVEIKFCYHNRETFKPDERVKMYVDLKNVSALYVKVFEFNSLNYFKKTKQYFRTDVNLDGLVATKEIVLEFDELPQKLHRTEIDLPHLDDRLGVFIIELIANGYSSRATIKKGALSLIHKASIAGHIAYIVNEEHKICSEEDTGIWYQNEFYKANVEKGGRILIPYEKYHSSDQAILVHNGFAHLETFTRLPEEYNFD